MSGEKTEKIVELIDRDRTLKVLEGVTEGAAHGEGAQLVRALVFATMKSKSLVPTVAVGQTNEWGNVKTVTTEYTVTEERTYSFEESEDGETEAVETVPLEKVARFLGTNYEPPVWYDYMYDDRRWEKQPEEVWKDVLRAVALEEEEE